MSLITDISFVSRLNPYLKGLKHTGAYNYAARCPFCGDSKKNSVKRRGGFFRGKEETSGMLLFACFNCGVSTTLGKVIQHVSSDLYNEYRLEKYREEEPEHEIELDEKDVDFDIFKTSSRKLEIVYDAALDDLTRLDKLSSNHPAVQYVVNRMIPKNVWYLFYYAPKFMTWTNTLVKKFELREKDYPRLIIPFFNEHGKMFAFAARAFGTETPKYYTIKLDENEEKIYGRERLDYAKPILVVEGQIDSVLLPNCISVSGSSFDTDYIRGIITNCILCPDNEPRNPQIVQLYKKYIAAGYKICMLPDSFKYKDINEAIQGGMTQSEIVQVINTNSYQGLTAEIKFAEWNKCQNKQQNSFSSQKSLNKVNQINNLEALKAQFSY